MNAYELAKLLEVDSWYKLVTREEITAVLREQAIRIAELEKQLSIMEGEYPEPTVFAKITEFNSLEESYNRIAELEEKNESLNKTYEMYMGYQNELRAKIAELEKDNKELHSIAQRMAMAESDARKSLQNFKNYEMNKPVAWMDKRTNKCVVFINTPPSDDWIPLYTHPVKQLSDEEILAIYEKCQWASGYIYWKEFAKAIIKEITE